MNVVDVGQACDTLHVDLFNSISQKSNNENMTSQIFENIQLPSLERRFLGHKSR